MRAFEFEDWTVDRLQAGMRGRRFRSVQLVEAYLRRIRELDWAGPGLRSVIEVNPDALEVAAALDRERRAGRERGPLHGIPVLLKDNLDTGDRQSTTAGSMALAGSSAPRDSRVAAQLRAAGAVILGKTNLSEWANFRSNHSTSGWSGRGGQTRNPYVLDRNPSGSSSGSAVAVAANLCAVAVGTETDGSILSPSSYCGLVGLKPTVGLVSRAGIIPISHTQDTAGPMARTVRDAADLLSAMVTTPVDERDPATASGRGKGVSDYGAGLSVEALRGARVGVARKLFGISGGAEGVIEEALADLRRLGAVLVDPADLPSHGQFGAEEFEVMLYEFKAGLNAYLAGRGPGVPVKSLADLIAFNDRERAVEMPWFGQEILIQAEGKGPLTDPAYTRALEKCRRLARGEGIDAILDRERLEALVAPTCGPAHVTDYVHGDRDTGGSTSPAAVAGYPSITVPAGQVRGLPVGLTFFGRAWSEGRLLQMAYAYEQATKRREPPRFRSTLA